MHDNIGIHDGGALDKKKRDRINRSNIDEEKRILDLNKLAIRCQCLPPEYSKAIFEKIEAVNIEYREEIDAITPGLINSEIIPLRGTDRINIQGCDFSNQYLASMASMIDSCPEAFPTMMAFFETVIIPEFFKKCQTS